MSHDDIDSSSKMILNKGQGMKFEMLQKTSIDIMIGMFSILVTTYKAP